MLKNLALVFLVFVLVGLGVVAYVVFSDGGADSPVSEYLIDAGETIADRVRGDESSNQVVVDFGDERGEVCFGDECFEVEIADDFAEQQQGLMFREKLARDAGMIFVYPTESTHRFWMKNTLIPLDIVWISRQGVVVDIEHEAEPCDLGDGCPSIVPGARSLYVLEVNGGEMKRRDVQVGDSVSVELP